MDAYPPLGLEVTVKRPIIFLVFLPLIGCVSAPRPERFDTKEERRWKLEAINKLSEERNSRSLIGYLRNVEEVHEAAVQALIEIGAKAIEPLIEALRSPDANTRAGAASALGGIETRKAVGPLIAALEEKDEFIRGYEGYAMIRTGVHCYVALALGEIGDKRAAEPLITVMRTGNKHAPSMAVEALGKIGGERAIAGLLQELARGEGWLGIARALGRTGDRSCVPRLREIMDENDDELIRVSAACALTLLDSENNDDAIKFLINSAKPNEVTVLRDRARSALNDAGPQIVEPLIETLLEDQNISWSVAITLGQIGDPRAVEPLIQVLEDKSRTGRQPVAIALSIIGDKRATPPLIRILLKSGEWSLRQNAAQALGELDDPRAIEPLSEALKDKHHYVRRSAAGALKKIKGK